MFLTKKSIVKIALMAILYFLIGSVSIAFGVCFNSLGLYDSSFFVIGIILYLICPLIVLWGRYSEGVGKVVARFNKLVRRELKPAEFIKEYEELKASPKLGVCKPRYDFLGCLCVAYECLDDHESALSVAEEAISVAGKKKSRALLLKASLLYSCGRVDEAERILEAVERSKPDLVSKGMIDMIRKGDRAMAIGDYNTVINTSLVRLEQKFPKLDNLAEVALHHVIAEAYEKLGDTENAVTYYHYCAEHGGETAYKATAASALERLK